ncbi:unnamed protein product [Discosporangium mesarthrocarpum]
MILSSMRWRLSLLLIIGGTYTVGAFSVSPKSAISVSSICSWNGIASREKASQGKSRGLCMGEIPRTWGIKWLHKLRARTRQSSQAHDDILVRDREGVTLTIPQAERYSSSDWVHNILTIPTSVILHRIKMPLLAQTSWATLVLVIHAAFRGSWCLSMKPHTLLGSALGLLLVFRTNAAYNRFQEGRKLWEKVLNASRDIARMVMLYENVFGRKSVLRVARLLSVYAVILQEHLKGYKNPAVWEHLLPDRDVDELMTTAYNRPLLLINKLAKEVRKAPYDEDWSSRERLGMLSMVQQLGHALGGCERLVQTPVPLHYVRHTSRFLTLWCFMLPLVLVGELGLATVPIAALSTWALFGIQEIGLLIEDPFQTALKLDIISNTIHMDVMQTIGEEDSMIQEPSMDCESISRMDVLDEIMDRTSVKVRESKTITQSITQPANA